LIFFVKFSPSFSISSLGAGLKDRGKIFLKKSQNPCSKAVMQRSLQAIEEICAGHVIVNKISWIHPDFSAVFCFLKIGSII
jgi:hypothetical protein